jgi:Mg2+ and Co2+ transporter CorA
MTSDARTRETSSWDPLSEEVMGFFAILALALALASVVLDLSDFAEHTLDVLQWAVVALFAAEYGVNLWRASDRRAYVTSAWRLLDLVIILGPFASLIAPEWSGALATPTLRLLRVVLFSARLGGLATRQATTTPTSPTKPATRISMCTSHGAPTDASWDDLIAHIGDRAAEAWFHASGLDGTHVEEIARRAGIAPTFLAQTLNETAYPRVEVYHRFSALFVWVPRIAEGGETVERNGVLLLATDHGVLSVAQRAMGLHVDVTSSMKDMALPPGTFARRTLLALLKYVLHRYEAVAGELERHARALERVPSNENRSTFLERSFRLQRQVAEVKSDLWRLKGILEAIADRRLAFHGVTTGARGSDEDEQAVTEFLRVLVDEASYVYDTTSNAREALLSRIDLHINVSSFELNQVMRVLAVISGLGLIPSAVGGMLGMNIFGNPWPVTLAEVSFGVSTTMVLALYVFIVKGWLR